MDSGNCNAIAPDGRGYWINKSNIKAFYKKYTVILVVLCITVLSVLLF